MKRILQINGRNYALDLPAKTTLLAAIRDYIGLVGTKEGCGTGECGACTVLVDQQPVNACLMLAAQAEGKDILTIEGLSRDGNLDPIQQAFIDTGAVQCGYCIPGMIMTGKGLLLTNPHPSIAQIKEAIAGNLCRCTGYYQIVAAIAKASQAR